MKLLNRDGTSIEPIVEPKKGLIRRKIGEISTGWTPGRAWGVFGSFRRSFWPSGNNYRSGPLPYGLTRRIYKNDDKKFNLGATLGKRIVNSRVDFIDLPWAVTGDDIVDEFLNRCFRVFWTSEIQQMIRDCVRDSKTIVRVRRPDPRNPLVSADEFESCRLEILPPENVTIFYSTIGDNTVIDLAYVRHEIEEVEEKAQDNGSSLMQPRTKTHVLFEEITPSESRFWDETDHVWRDDLEETNEFGFVPLVECYNEFDAASGEGQSEYDNCLPFIYAFHDVVQQTLIAHKAHAIPKAKFKVNDMMSFIAANWPDAFEHDEMGNPKMETFDGSISWKGTEMFFMQSEEDVEFLQVQSALGDSKSLMDFLITCLVIASETPRSVLFDQTVEDTDDFLPFSKMINRKRRYFQPVFQMLAKMVMSVNSMSPDVVQLAWDEITPDLALKKAQTMEQDVMSLEVLAARQVISDNTIRRTLRPSIPLMKRASQEASDAKDNVLTTSTSAYASEGGTGAPTNTGSVSGNDAGNKQTRGRPN